MKKQKHLYKIVAVSVFLSAFVAQAVFAAPGVPNIGGAVKQAAPPKQEAPAKAPEAPVIVQEEEKPFSIPEGKKIFIKDFALEGIQEKDRAALDTLLTPYKNKDLAMAEIVEAANKITLFYRDKGFMVAKAWIPKQDASSGVLTFKVVLGEYGKFTLNNLSLVKTSFLQQVFDTTQKTSPVVTRDGLERAMMLTGELPGCKMPMVSIAPGAAPGTSDFTVNVDKGQRVGGYVMADNQGSEYTGENRLYAGLDVNSPFGIADKLSVSAMTTDESDMQSLRGAYSLPVNHNGLRAEVAASRTIYELGGVYSVLDATGTADTVEGTLFYPVKRSQDAKIDLSLNLAYKEMSDDMDVVNSKNPRNATVSKLALQRESFGALFGHKLATTTSGSVSLGTLNIEDEDMAALNEAGADTAGAFSKVNLSFQGNLALTEKFSFTAGLKAQKAITKNLDSTEQMYVSGIGGVRAYTESVSFDNGYVANAELRYTLPEIFGVKHALGLFADNGWVWAQDGDYITKSRLMDDNVTISDAGLGYYLGYKKVFGTVQLAETLGSSYVEDPGTCVLAQVGMSF